MADTQPTMNANVEKTLRREFLRNAGQAAVAAPAVALLLTASARPAAAAYRLERQDYRDRPAS
jgi:hypothetical protein